MPFPVRRRLAQWLLLCAVAVGVIGMHHLASAQSEHGMGTAHHVVESSAPDHAITLADAGPTAAAAPTMPMSGHDMLHLCMAALMSTVAPLLLLLLALAAVLALSAEVVRAVGDLSRRRRGPPPRSGQQILSLVSVLRL